MKIYTISAYISNILIEYSFNDYGLYLGEFNNNYNINSNEEYIINNAIIQNNYHGGMIIDNANYTLITNSLFINNYHHYTAGALYILSKRIAVIVNTTFDNNKALDSGGAITIQGGNLGILYCNFTNNSAYNGGALQINQIELVPNQFEYIIFNGTDHIVFKPGDIVPVLVGRPFELFHSYFIDNYAHNGGAIFVTAGVYWIEHSTFINNYARGNGGAINDAMGLTGCENEGYYNNSAQIALADFTNWTSIISHGSKFISNNAYLGGGLYTTNCDMHIIAIFNVTKYQLTFFTHYFNHTDEFPLFANNTAVVSGGGIFFDVSTAILGIQNVLFYHNHAAYGGGGVAISGGYVFFAICDFEYNTAGEYGGAILIQPIEGFITAGTNIIITTVLIQYNEAAYGGAIAIQTLSTNIELIDYKFGDYIFTILGAYVWYNRAYKCGGGMYLNYGSADLRAAYLMYNTADVCGGGIHYVNGALMITYAVAYTDLQGTQYPSYILGNIAGQYGGGIVVESDLFIINGNSGVLQNTAESYGGGLYLTSCPLNVSHNALIGQNSVGISGGGYFIDTGDTICYWIDGTEVKNSLDHQNAYGNIRATFPKEPNVTWIIPKVFSSLDDLRVTLRLYDLFNQQVTSISPQDTFIMSIDFQYYIAEEDKWYTNRDITKCYNLIGDTTTDSFRRYGNATLEFNIIPLKNCSTVYESRVQTSFQFTINIIFDAPGSAKSELIMDYNETHAAIYQSQLYIFPSGIKILAHCLNGICLICLILSTFAIYKWRRSHIIAGARIPFMMIIIVGLFLMSFEISFTVMVPISIGCIPYMWIMIIGIILVLTPISAKTWAVYNIFQKASELKDFKWGNLKLFIVFVLIPSIIGCILLILWTLIATQQDENGAFIFDNNNEYLIEKCLMNNKNIIFIILGYVIMCISVLLLSYLAYKARHLPSNWNESKMLGGCIMTMLILLIFIIPWTFINKNGVLLQKIIQILSFFILIQSILLFLFYYKFYILFSNDGNIDKYMNEEVKSRSSKYLMSSKSPKSKSKDTSNDLKTPSASPRLPPLPPNHPKTVSNFSYDITEHDKSNDGVGGTVPMVSVDGPRLLVPVNSQDSKDEQQLP